MATRQSESSRSEQPNTGVLETAVAAALSAVRATLTRQAQVGLRAQEIGRVLELAPGVARVAGLPSVGADERLQFAFGASGMAFNLDPDSVGVVLLDDVRRVAAGDRVYRSGRMLDIPVGDGLLGRVLDGVGRPQDRRGPLRATTRWPIERPAAPILDRAPVSVPLQTGLKVIDALIPIGRGQRELILGDRQIGKTRIALDTIINQAGSGVPCVYCAIGQRESAVAQVIAELEHSGALAWTVVLVASAEDPPGLQCITPYAATSIAEWFMQQGQDALVVYDDLTRHARAYRELSLLLRRPPGREAFPGDIFYLHSRLLERATHLCAARGGGSLTALPILETEAQNLTAYIPTNLISITDGQIYLSPDLFHRGQLPAVDVGRSVSRVGGKTQLAAYRRVSGPLRLAYAQFEELEIFARFGARLDPDTRATIEHGRRVRALLRQDERQALSPFEQLVELIALTEGVFQDVPVAETAVLGGAIRAAAMASLETQRRRVEQGQELSDDDQAAILGLARRIVIAQATSGPAVPG